MAIIALELTSTQQGECQLPSQLNSDPFSHVGRESVMPILFSPSNLLNVILTHGLPHLCQALLEAPGYQGKMVQNFYFCDLKISGYLWY